MTTSTALASNKMPTNENGDIILEETRTGGMTRRRIRYGWIKLVGEKDRHRIRAVNVARITKMQKEKFVGDVELPECQLKVKLHQIVAIGWEEETVSKSEGFTNLPTKTVLFYDAEPYSELKIASETRYELERNGVNYWLGSCHYSHSNDEEVVIADFDKIPRLIYMQAQGDGYPHSIAAEYRYGEKTE